MAQAGIRLIIAGSTISYAIEETAGTRPTAASAYTKVPEITNIPEQSSAEYDQIDFTPVDEEEQHQTKSGLRQAPGILNYEANLSDTLLTFWNTTLMNAYTTANAAGKKMWICLTIKGMDKAFYYTAEPKPLAPSGGGAADSWKCSLPLTMTNTPIWDDKPSA